MHTCASLVGARGSHCPPVSFSLMAAMENCEHAREREREREADSKKQSNSNRQIEV
jgi:hypothetical protein